MAQQPLSAVCNVTVSVSPVAQSAPSFNQGLIVGSSSVIPSVGANSRVRTYTSTDGLLSDGFTTNSPEFLAAQLYFQQTPTPTTLQIGRRDLTAIATLTLAAAGTGYAAGDQLTVTQSGASGSVLQVATVGGTGNVTAVTLMGGGTGYAVASGLTTTGGTGTGCTVSISAIGESALVALQACRVASTDWWASMVCGSAAADHTAIGAWIGSINPPAAYFYSTSDGAVLVNGAGSVTNTLKSASYRRVCGVYSTTQGGTYPNNAYSAAAVMGECMGLNTGLANSNFTLKFKQLSGVIAENLTTSQVLAIEGQNCNLYLPYQGGYTWFEQGKMANGTFVDEVLGTDMLAADIQYSVINKLIQLPSVPHDDIGQSVLLDVVHAACERAKQRGFIASSGTWDGQTVLNVSEGTVLAKGYSVQSQPFSLQSAGDKAARKAMPIYVTAILARSMHSVVIGVYED